jgi:soluble lytic murein transglycosylase
MLNFFKKPIIKLTFIAIGLLWLLSSRAYAASGDVEFLQARMAYDKKNAIALSEHVQQLQHQNYILAPYADYWLMLLNLEDADNQTVLDFMHQYSDYPFADRLRGEYLKKLAKQQDWENFSGEVSHYQLEDSAVACYAAEASAELGDASVLEGAKLLWLQSKEQAANCANLYDRMQAAGVLNEDDIFERLRLALADNRLALAKSIIKRSKTFAASQYQLIDRAYNNPSAVLAKKSISFKTRLGRELNLFALSRLAKTNSQQAFNAFNKVADLFQQEDKSYFYGRLAWQAALRHEPEALGWFKLAESIKPNKEQALGKEQLAWFARAGLREKNWDDVLLAISKMHPDQAAEGAWRYWKARALKAKNQSLEANTLFAKLSTERHFYGWLAQEELDGAISAPLNMHKVTDEEVAEIANSEAFQRVEALQRVDLRWEAKSEWAHASRNLDDKQLLAAAEFAQRRKWYDLAIITADKTTEMHDFALRYPTPYRDLIKDAAEDNAVDEAWVYGITRQESRFMHYAKSGVGAAGLMQLMPATAKWIAGRAGVSDYHHGMIHDLDTNIALGTYYMGYTKDLMSGQETMATAAYNAGPSRAKKWMAAVPLEGAIYAETIPFSETRLYVQKVMANAHLYAPRLGLKSMPLKQRLGVIPSKYGTISSNPETQQESQQVNELSLSVE